MRGLWLLFVPAAVYQLLAIAAELIFLKNAKGAPSRPQTVKETAGTAPDERTVLRKFPKNRRPPRDLSFQPGISVLKPLRGLDAGIYEAFVSQVQQSYPQFEILFGVREANDPAAAEVRRLQRDFPAASIRLVVGGADTPNGKAGVLMELAQQAIYPVWVVNDSDIKVSPDYLREVVEPLAAESTGVVTCLYRATGSTAAAQCEALGIATDFMPSTLVAQILGVREFGLGSTLAFRAADLDAAGGFAAIADYLADDYQLAKRITRLGKRALISICVVETSLGDASWAEVWRHQLRWARTIRVSKGAGYAGLPITHAGLWILLAAFCGAWLPATVLFAGRLFSAVLSSAFVLRSPSAALLCWLAPVWDLFAFCVWIASYAGREVRWRNRILRIDRQGRILS